MKPSLPVTATIPDSGRLLPASPKTLRMLPDHDRVKPISRCPPLLIASREEAAGDGPAARNR